MANCRLYEVTVTAMVNNFSVAHVSTYHVAAPTRAKAIQIATKFVYPSFCDAVYSKASVVRGGCERVKFRRLSDESARGERHG